MNLLEELLSSPKEETKCVLKKEVSLLINGEWKTQHSENVTDGTYKDCYESALMQIVEIIRTYAHDSECEVHQPTHIGGIYVIIDGWEKTTFTIAAK